MSNLEIIKCKHCNKNINKKKQEYYREEKVEYIEECDSVEITPAFKYRWYYCDKCKNYFALDGDKSIHLIKYDKESEELFKDYNFEDLKRYRRIIMKDLITSIEEEIYENRYDDYFDCIFYTKPNRLCSNRRYYKNNEFCYDVKIDENLNYIISIKNISSKEYTSRYSRLEEDLKLIEYNFDKLEKYRKEIRCSWKTLAKCIDMTEQELKLILKNKTKRKLNRQQLMFLMMYIRADEVGGYSVRDLERI